LAYRLLSSGWINRNQLYKKIYSRRIKSIQERSHFPRIVSVEGTNFCNSACVMCGHKNMQRPKGVMPIELYKNILSQLKGWPIESLLLSGFGEPLLDPLLEERISLARSNGFGNIGIVTNASLLHPDKVSKLRIAGLDFMHISMDGATKETYQKLRPGLDFDTIVSNLSHLLSTPKRPRIYIQVVTLEENIDELNALRRMWGPKADRLIFRQSQDWAGQVTLPNQINSPHLIARPQWPPCRYLWDQLNIYWDGTVPLCCLDYEARQVVGSADKQSLQSIWQGGELSDIRQKHNAGHRDKIALCRHCRYFSVWW